MYWLTYNWWKYLLKGCTGWTNFWCRIRNHNCGVVWHNVAGVEPDMHCRKCGEDLG